MKYKYFVTWIHSDAYHLSTVENTEIERDLPICDIEDIAAIERLIRKRNGGKSATVLNWKRFESYE